MAPIRIHYRIKQIGVRASCPIRIGIINCGLAHWVASGLGLSSLDFFHEEKWRISRAS